MSNASKPAMYVLEMTTEEFSRALGLPAEVVVHRIETKITPAGYAVELVLWRDEWTGDIALFEDWQRRFISESRGEQ